MGREEKPMKLHKIHHHQVGPKWHRPVIQATQEGEVDGFKVQDLPGL